MTAEQVTSGAVASSMASAQAVWLRSVRSKERASMPKAPKVLLAGAEIANPGSELTHAYNFATPGLAGRQQADSFPDHHGGAQAHLIHQPR
jgi:hypothetical protein